MKEARASERQVEIQLSSGDRLVSSGAVAISNVIKIDTEGFELRRAAWSETNPTGKKP